MLKIYNLFKSKTTKIKTKKKLKIYINSCILFFQENEYEYLSNFNCYILRIKPMITYH